MRFILTIVIALCLTAAAAAAAAKERPTEPIPEASDDEQVDVVIDDDGNEAEEIITADSYGVTVKDGKIIHTKNGQPVENESPPKTQPKPSVIDIDDVLVDLDQEPASGPKPTTAAPIETDAEEVQYDIDERFSSDAPDGISEVKGSDKVVLGVQLSGALIKLNKQDRRANFELDQMISAMREKRSRDFIYRVEAILAPRNDRCHLVLLEQEDADYQKLNVICGRRTYEVSDGISREQRFEEANRDRNNHGHHDRPLYNRPHHDHHRRP